jgi:hypothetical protein
LAFRRAVSASGTRSITDWLDENCGADGWALTPAGTCGVLNDAISVYFAAAIAAREGRSPDEVAYDYLTGDAGHFLFFPVTGYARDDHEPIREMLVDPGKLRIDSFIPPRGCLTLPGMEITTAFIPRRIPSSHADTRCDAPQGGQGWLSGCAPAPRQRPSEPMPCAGGPPPAPGAPLLDLGAQVSRQSRGMLVRGR